jgi:hypothetical protein
VERSGFEPSAPLRLVIAKLPANLAGYSELIKAEELQRALSPRFRPQVILSGPSNESDARFGQRSKLWAMGFRFSATARELG